MADDYYSVLGVAKSATPDEIQKAYRRLARKHHPDLADDKEKAKEQFQKIQHAYDVLSDPEKRQMYDQLGPAFEQGGGRPPFAGGQMPEGFEFEQAFGGGGRGGGGFEDILRQVFGAGAAGGEGPFAQRGGAGARTQPPPARGQDVEQEITIPFATAILGGKHQLSLTRSSGDVETITVTIPAGISDGKKIRLRGQGRSSPRGGPRGDLLVKIKVAPHPVYQRSGDNLQVVVPVTIWEAALGSKIDLPTPHGQVTLTIPPGSSGGRLLRLKGLGVKRAEGKSGDIVAELRIAIPDKLSDEQKRLIRELAEASAAADNPRTGLKW